MTFKIDGMFKQWRIRSDFVANDVSCVEQTVRGLPANGVCESWKKNLN